MYNLPLEITYRNLSPTEAIDNRIRHKAQKLTRFFDKIISCHVVVYIPQKFKGEHHKHVGISYNVEIKLEVPNEILVVNRQPNADLYTAIRDAFAAMTRQLEDYADCLRNEVKVHNSVKEGRVVRLLDGYGFIKSNDGEEYYFDNHAIAQNSFNHLVIGSRVQFHEAVASDGLQAKQVRTINHRVHTESA